MAFPLRNRLVCSGQTSRNRSRIDGPALVCDHRAVNHPAIGETLCRPSAINPFCLFSVPSEISLSAPLRHSGKYHPTRSWVFRDLQITVVTYRPSRTVSTTVAVKLFTGHYNKMVRETSIIAAGVQFYLNVIGKEEWSVEPAEADTDGEFAEYAERILFNTASAWPQIIRRAALYRFFGFSIQEWVAKKDKDGLVILEDLEPRPVRTIEQWNTDVNGRVLGMIQRSPQTQHNLYLPAAKTLFLNDRSLSDAPHGYGLLRSMVETAKRLSTFETLECIGFETDLRGIPIVRAPLSDIDGETGENEVMNEAERAKLLEPLTNFLKNHGRTPDSGLMLDSKTYEKMGDETTPSNVPMWRRRAFCGVPASAFAETNARPSDG